MTADRWDDLEARVRALEARLESTVESSGESSVAPSGAPPDAPAVPTPDAFWVLTGLRERLHDAPDGAVLFAGSVRVDSGPVEWQYGQQTGDLLESDADARTTAAERLAALGHPIRIQLLQAVLAGHTSPAGLAELEGLGTTGQVYHHIRILTTAGWLRSARRNHVEVPPERVVPLLVALAAVR